ncbi:hypothetical protein [Leptolyngbya sp. FACHB-8]|nr:hypothetical protein [Leptolyngbya sp. FACHB-8]
MDWDWDSHRRMQRALQDWYGRQAQRLHGEAEAIREGALQEVFALRRQLELMELGASGEMPVSPHVANQLYEQLKTLSDRLSPSFLQDNLPLAIATRLEAWQQLHPSITIHSTLPAEWVPGPYERSYFLLTTLDDLLSLVLTESVTAIAIKLTDHTSTQGLEIDVHVTERWLEEKESALQDLGCVFQFLMSGKYDLEWDDPLYRWRGIWPTELLL